MNLDGGVCVCVLRMRDSDSIEERVLLRGVSLSRRVGRAGRLLLLVLLLALLEGASKSEIPDLIRELGAVDLYGADVSVFGED